jgi:hypothetical protein
MADLTLEERIDLYRFLRLNRLLEERLVLLYRQGRIAGGLYRSLGQEATSVGSAFALEKGDVLGPLIRNLGSVLVMGYSAREVLTQHLGRAASPSGGKEGNLHFGRPERGVVSSISRRGRRGDRRERDEDGQRKGSAPASKLTDKPVNLRAAGPKDLSLEQREPSLRSG